MTTPLALVVTGPGTNRDPDVSLALELAGARAETVDSAALAADPRRLDRAALLVVAGGFSFGDALGAGRMLALDLELHLHDALRSFVDRGRPVLGICNGFQVLTRAGLLPGALGHNDHGRFVCGWVTLQPDPASRSIWTAGLDGPIDVPVAHGEGRYVHPDPDGLAASGRVALRYDTATGIALGNPNGSVDRIAGVCDAGGTVLGLMPHPENHVLARQHPRHGRVPDLDRRSGLQLFRAGVQHARTA